MTTGNGNEKKNFKKFLDDLERYHCPTINGALPSIPGEMNKRVLWFGLSKEFVFSHHPSHGHKLDGPISEGQDESKDKIADNLFCVPEEECARLKSIILKSRGGSILVTGYRGTGKSSLVYYTIADIQEEYENFVPIPINLSTARDAGALVDIMIKELYQRFVLGKYREGYYDKGWMRFVKRVKRWVCWPLVWIISKKKVKQTIPEELEEMYLRCIGTRTKTRGSSETEETEVSGNLHAPGITETGAKQRNEKSKYREDVHQEHPYTLHEKQLDLSHWLKRVRGKKADDYRIICWLRSLLKEKTDDYAIIRWLKKILKKKIDHHAIIFIFDELDKLTPPSDRKPETRKLIQLQKMVSDLKFLLTESNSYHVFIAGKDVDDSWQEDQNKGEGLFESVFIQNVYLPSSFVARLRPRLGPHDWIEKAWKAAIEKLWEKAREEDMEEVEKEDIQKMDVAKEKFIQIKIEAYTRELFVVILEDVGISKTSWSFSTGLLVLPHLAEYEIKKLLLRFVERRSRLGGSVDEENKAPFPEWLEPLRDDIQEENKTELQPMSERRARNLRYCLQYLTYKGRGIPRKILREFYGTVRKRGVMNKPPSYWVGEKKDVGLIIYTPALVRQKMKFFSTIVARLEDNPDIFRALDDKGCVATFHIIDYILKFYQTGFTWLDIEHASFMTQREELFPSRELVSYILRTLEDFLIERLDRRHRSYKLLPRAQHDLAGLYLAFGPEQIELRFTSAEFENEKMHLSQTVEKVVRVDAGSRLESFKAQIRLGEIEEHLGAYDNARLEYSKALRWVRMDIARILAAGGQSLDCDIEQTFVVTYFTSAVEVLQKLGYLYEKEREFRKALGCYSEAVRIHEGCWSMQMKRSQSILNSADRNLPVGLLPKYKRKILDVALEILNFDHEPDKTKQQKYGILTEIIDYRAMLDAMVPEYRWEDIAPFTLFKTVCGEKVFPVYPETKYEPQELFTGHEPHGLPYTLNMIAVVLEKTWHRYACNRYLLNVLDYYRRIHDEYGKLDQMIFIGELLMRRRDIRRATAWYLLALIKFSEFQKGDQVLDLTAKMPEQQSRMRAKLFEHLGDVFFASRGTVFLTKDQMEKLWEDMDHSEDVETNISTALKDIHKIIRMEMIDDRTDEYFYTQASIHYIVNDQILRACDVYMKKLVIRHDRMILDFNKYNSEKKTKEKECLFGEIVRSWCSFWVGTEKIMNLLINASPKLRKAYPLRIGRIIDRRRFGALYTRIGGMMATASGYDDTLYSFYWEAEKESEKWDDNCDLLLTNLQSPPPKKMEGPFNRREQYIAQRIDAFFPGFSKENKEEAAPFSPSDEPYNLAMNLIANTDIFETSQAINRIIGFLVDNEKMVEEKSGAEINICEEGEIGYSSPLSGILAQPWRNTSARPKIEDFAEPLRSCLKHPNGLLFGMVFYLIELILTKVDSKEEGKSPADLKRIRREVRFCYRAEICYLGARACLDDNINDLDSADACRGVGVLYVKGCHMVFQLRKCFSELDNELEGVGLDDIDSALAFLYQQFHRAAKRFLLTAIETYRQERIHERCVRQLLGNTWRALGDLMCVRAEVLTSLLSNEIEESDATFAGLFGEPKDMAESGGCNPNQDKLKGKWKDMDKFVGCNPEKDNDDDLKDVRRQADEAYRKACNQFLSEIEDYTKRYRFSHEAYFAHRNVMDRRMHFKICEGIQRRHWNYYKDNARGKEAYKILAVQMWRLSLTEGRRQPRVHDRQQWLADVCDSMALANEMCTIKPYVEIKITKDNKRTIKWINNAKQAPTSEKEQSEKEQNKKRLFFRSFDDGVAFDPDWQTES